MVVGLTLSCRETLHDFGNPPEVEWIRIYENYSSGHGIKIRPNEGFVVVGNKYSKDKGYWPFLLTTDSRGDSVWSVVFEEYERGSGRDVRQTIDGGYIMVGTIYETRGEDERILCIRTDSIGNTIWIKNYAGDKTAHGSSIEQTDDGFIIAGVTSSFGNMEVKLYLIRIDENGEKIWEKKYGEEFRSGAMDILRTSDGNFINVGWIGIEDYNVYILKVDIAGNCIWSKKYRCDGNYNIDGYSVAESSDGGYVIIGYAVEKSYIIKTDSLGNTLWMEEIGLDETKTRCLSIEQTADGGYIISGAVSSYKGDLNGWSGWNIYITKTDSIGGIQWVKSIGNQDNGCGQEIRQTEDNGYIVTGMLDGNMCLIKLKPEE